MIFGGESFKFGTDNQLDVGLNFDSTDLARRQGLYGDEDRQDLHELYTEDMVREAEAQIVYGVRRAFLGAILTQDVVKVYQDALATAEYESRHRKQDVFAGSRLGIRVAARTGGGRQSQTAVDSDAESRRHCVGILKNLIGVKLSESLELQYEFDSTMVGRQLNLEYLQKLARANRASLQQQEHLQDITRRAIGIAKSGRKFQSDFPVAIWLASQGDDDSFQLFKRRSTGRRVGLRL